MLSNAFDILFQKVKVVGNHPCRCTDRFAAIYLSILVIKRIIDLNIVITNKTCLVHKLVYCVCVSTDM